MIFQWRILDECIANYYNNNNFMHNSTSCSFFSEYPTVFYQFGQKEAKQSASIANGWNDGAIDHLSVFQHIDECKQFFSLAWKYPTK